jgi:hypothetical protein
MSTVALGPGEITATCNRCGAGIVFPSADNVWPPRWRSTFCLNCGHLNALTRGDEVYT